MTAVTMRWLAAGILLAATGCMDPMGWGIPEARTSPPPAAFNETGSFGWYAAWGMAQSDLGRYVAEQKRRGMRLHDIEVYKDEGATRFAGIWLKDPRAWYGRWRYTRGQFDRDFKVLCDKGYQLTDIEVINEKGTLRYSSVWIENPGGPGWRAGWDLRPDELLDQLESWRARGYRPIDIETYGIEGRIRHAYVMAHDPAGAGWTARWGKTADAMTAELDSLVRQDHRIVDFELSYPQGERRVSAIFLKDGGGHDTRWTLCRSSGELKQAIDRLGGGHRPVHMAIYPHKEGGLAYAWIWGRN